MRTIEILKDPRVWRRLCGGTMLLVLVGWQLPSGSLAVEPGAAPISTLAKLSSATAVAGDECGCCAQKTEQGFPWHAVVDPDDLEDCDDPIGWPIIVFLDPHGEHTGWALKSCYDSTVHGECTLFAAGLDVARARDFATLRHLSTLPESLVRVSADATGFEIMNCDMTRVLAFLPASTAQLTA